MLNSSSSPSSFKVQQQQQDVTILLKNNENNDSLDIHHLPCSIEFDGIAKKKNDSESNNLFTARFRGRPLRGKTIDLNKESDNLMMNVNGYVLNEENKCVHEFTKLKSWSLDKDPNLETTFSNTFDWMQISSIIHHELDYQPSSTIAVQSNKQEEELN
ncbi:hypothetical protein ABK040_002274 [Willaertia magna]